jgi:hypothetical protein
MKVLRNILIVIMALVVLMCLLVGISTVRPDLFSRFTGKGEETKEEASTVSEVSAPEEESDVEEVSDNNVTVSVDEAEAIIDAYFAEEEGDIPQAGLRGGISANYTMPTESVNVPDAMKELCGLQDLEGEYSKLTPDEADRIEEELSEGETGDDLSFDELYYPYYHMLDMRGQHLYRQIYANAMEQNDTFKSVEKDMPWSSFKNTFEAVFNDHPELFWLNTKYSARYRDNGECLEVKLSFNRTAEDIEGSAAKFDEGANAMGTQAGGDVYDQEKAIHDAIADAVSYSLSAEMNQSSYSALVNKSTVCAGYARAFQYIMQQLGVPCYYCRGVAGEPHAWNIIKLYDGYYNVDVTWDDSSSGEKYAYFNLSDAEIGKDHRRAGLSVYLPACEGGNYSHLEDGQVSENGAREEEGTQGERPEGPYCRSIEEYYDLCTKEIKDTGKGIYTFDIYTTDREVYDKCVDAYTKRKVEAAYMKDCLSDIENAKGLIVELDARELDSGVYKMTQRVQCW